MVRHQRLLLPQLRIGEFPQPKDPIDTPRIHHILLTQYIPTRPSDPTLFRILLLFSLFCCTLLFAPRLLVLVDEQLKADPFLTIPPPCSTAPNNTICCDRTARRTDVCFMRGDIRTHAATNSLLLANTNSTTEETIRPYTRKWESNTMSTIDELRLRGATAGNASTCDVQHSVPAIVFSTGGYTGNVYHEFNDGIIPLFITAHKFNKQVVFVLLEYHDWWITKYGEILAQLSDYPPIDFTNDNRTHCFSEATVGLRIHDELTVDSTQMADNKTIFDFSRLLDNAYRPRLKAAAKTEKLKLVIVSRKGSRAITNEAAVAQLAAGVGFEVEILRPKRSTELVEIYEAIDRCDVMVGVHGAAMTHLLFMRPGAVFIQVVPLGTDWAAGAYYGEPAVKMGLKYIPYRIRPRESSLYKEYRRDDAVLRDPESVNARGWETTKKVYLDGQKVKLDLARFRKRLVRAYQYSISRKERDLKQLGSWRGITLFFDYGSVIHVHDFFYLNI